MGKYLREISDSYPMNTKMTEFKWFSLDESSLSIEGLTH